MCIRDRFVIDELGVVESDILEYVDDGVSGTHFKRQGFQQLQDDMKSGEKMCIRDRNIVL